MDVTITIPDGIYQAIQQGTGRIVLEREFGLSERRARYYLQAYEEAAPQPTQTVAIVADLHLPDHAAAILEIILTEILTWTPDVLVFLGDILDCEALGFWAKPPTRRRFGQELRRVWPVWEAINTRVAAIPRKILVEGNHEARVQRYLWDHAAALSDVEVLTVPALLRLQEDGWEWWAVRDRLTTREALLRFGALLLLHGHEVKAPSARVINPAKSYSERLFTGAVVGHVHRTSQWPPRVFFGNHPVYTVGCVQQLNVQYDPLNRWNWGFGKLTWNAAMTTFRNYRITARGEIE